ncbi:hypothetical protein NW762_007595 [Fusarium torreyae]|uniref:AAA+ ATPase domain-containing protein n=1 Tax=Fusarium torreyae TaxID=1237075 RepID=A0A9W8RZW8_9HYPO|nr:hypothetical protein NW762_007595 [Fusarium torreyae]
MVNNFAHKEKQTRPSNVNTPQVPNEGTAGNPKKPTFNAQGESQRLAQPVHQTKPPDVFDIIPEVRKCDWESFVNRFSIDEPIYAVEYLETGERLVQEMADETRMRTASCQFEQPELREQNHVNKLYTDASWIERIRIQSPVLMQILRQVTGFTWGSTSYTFLHPFQYLIHHHEALKDELKRWEKLESKHQDQNDEKHKISHLRCYVDFMEDAIMPRYRQLREGTTSVRTRIRFRELWYLFKHGDLIYVPEKTLMRMNEANRSIMSSDTWSYRKSNETTMYQKIWRLYDTRYWAPAPPSLNEIKRSLALASISGISMTNEEEYNASAYYLDHDGVGYSPVSEEFIIEHFEGEKDIRELDFFPLKYLKTAPNLLEEQRKIGSMFIERHDEWHLSYSGWTLLTNPTGLPLPETDQWNKPLRSIDGEVIVSFAEAYNEEPDFRSTFSNNESWNIPNTSITAVTGSDILAVWSDSERSSIISGSHETVVKHDNIRSLNFEEYLKKDKYIGPHKDPRVREGDDLALLPRRLFVYSLKDSKFAPIDVRFLKSLSWGNDGFSQLQLHESHRQVVQSSVQTYLNRRPIERQIENREFGTLYTQDFLKGKGRGLLIMLHGEPGTGKTATAEAVAQKFRRPLLPLSCGAITGAEKIEVQLDKVFRLSTIWDCILLLDEADVLLSARSSTSDIARNSLVSVFLRKLEYFNGVLFLTTNRIGKIDEAISSRLHLILHYKRLKYPEIEKVFRTNIDRLRQSEEQYALASGTKPLVVVESDVMQFVADHCAKHPEGKGAWNGRQIRNAFVIATGIARDEAEQQNSPDFQPQLRYSHFKRVERLFDEYIQFRQRVLGKDDAERALLNEERDDDFDGVPEEDRKQSWPPPMGRSQTDQPQRAPQPSHLHYSRQAPPHQQQFSNRNGFPARPYGYDSQPHNTWGMNTSQSHGYDPIRPGNQMNQFSRAPFHTAQSEAALDSRPEGPSMSQFAQHQVPGYSQGQIPQVSIGGASTGGIGQDQLTQDISLGEFMRQERTDALPTDQS